MGPIEITVELDLGTDPDTIWSALTTPESIMEWKSAKRDRDWAPEEKVRLELEVGGRLVDRYFHNDTLFTEEWRITEIEEGRRLAFEWVDHGSCPLQFILEGSRLRITQGGLETADEAERHREGWSRVLNSLKNYLETGRGLALDDWRAQGNG